MALVGVGYAYEKFMLEVDGRFLTVFCNFLNIAGEQNNNAVLTWSQMINSIPSPSIFKIFPHSFLHQPDVFIQITCLQCWALPWNM